MDKALSSIATITLGFPFKGKIAESAEGEFRVVQIKDLTAEKGINWDTLVSVEVRPGFGKFTLRAKDIIMPVRGGYYPSLLIHEPVENVIVPSHVFIIRAANDVLPAYLNWFLNQNVTQHYLKQLQTGTSIRMITKAALSNLRVEVPDFDTQEKIASIQTLWEKKKTAHEELIASGANVAQALCEKLMEESK